MSLAESPINRRQLLGGMLAAGSFASGLFPETVHGAEDKAVSNGRIKQSVCFWCFNTAGEKWDAEKTCQVARGLGCRSVELIGPEGWDLFRKYGRICAMASTGIPGAAFGQAFNNPKYHEARTP